MRGGSYVIYYCPYILDLLHTLHHYCINIKQLAYIQIHSGCKSPTKGSIASPRRHHIQKKPSHDSRFGQFLDCTLLQYAIYSQWDYLWVSIQAIPIPTAFGIPYQSIHPLLPFLRRSTPISLHPAPLGGSVSSFDKLCNYVFLTSVV
jgi:hypothetical protein